MKFNYAVHYIKRLCTAIVIVYCYALTTTIRCCLYRNTDDWWKENVKKFLFLCLVLVYLGAAI